MPPSGIQPFRERPARPFPSSDFTLGPKVAVVPPPSASHGKGQEDQGDDHIANPHFPVSRPCSVGCMEPMAFSLPSSSQQDPSGLGHQRWHGNPPPAFRLVRPLSLRLVMEPRPSSRNATYVMPHSPARPFPLSDFYSGGRRWALEQECHVCNATYVTGTACPVPRLSPRD
jgi:hypothetical protein